MYCLIMLNPDRTMYFCIALGKEIKHYLNPVETRWSMAFRSRRDLCSGQTSRIVMAGTRQAAHTPGWSMPPLERTLHEGDPCPLDRALRIPRASVGALERATLKTQYLRSSLRSFCTASEISVNERQGPVFTASTNNASWAQGTWTTLCH